MLSKFLILSLVFECSSLLYFKVIKYGSKNNKESIRNAFYYKRKRPHPYLGYQDNHLDLSKYFLKKIEDSQKYTIGIFGGSVAQQFCKYELEHNYLKEKIPHPINQIEVICFAHGGYRQPQQTLAFSLYGDHLDHALFIEGSNEFATQRLIEHIEYPLTRLSSAWYNTADQFFFTQIKLYLSEKLLLWGQSPSRTIFFSEDSIRNFSLCLSQQLVRRDSVTNIDTIDVDTLSKVWKKSLNLLDTVSSRSKTKVDVLIQPFIGTKKTPTAEESKFTAGTAYIKSFETYSNQVNELPVKNIKITSYLNFFKDSKTKDFIDDVHLTHSALDRMWKEIVEVHF